MKKIFTLIGLMAFFSAFTGITAAKAHCYGCAKPVKMSCYSCGSPRKCRNVVYYRISYGFKRVWSAKRCRYITVKYPVRQLRNKRVCS